MPDKLDLPIFLLVLLIHTALLPPLGFGSVNSKLEDEIVQLFIHDHCSKILSIAPPQSQQELSPLARAVVGYCVLDPDVAEEIFGKVEKENPNYDTIFTLHARYRWKRNPESSYPLWSHVYLVARSEAVKSMAQDYLSGTADEEKEFGLNADWSYVLSAGFGVSQESNPLDTPFSESKTSSFAFNLQASGNIERKLDFGNLALDYSFLNNRFTQAHTADSQDHAIEMPFSVHIGKSEDMVLRPFSGYSTLGNLPLQSYVGIGVRGIVFEDTYKQFVQGSIYKDWYLQKDLLPEAGMHFRFEYNWEFFPFPWFLQLFTFIEHVKADRDTIDDAQLTITYSHTTLGIQTLAECEFTWGKPSILFQVLNRQDSENSYFPTTQSSIPVVRRRVDYTLEIRPSLTIPLQNYLSVTAYYQYMHAFSNIGPDDYTDRNFEDQAIGIMFKAILAGFK